MVDKTVSTILPTKELDIKSILLSNKLITESKLNNYISESSKYHLTLEEYLISNNIISKDILNAAIAENYSTKYANLNNLQIEDGLFYLLPESLAKKYLCVLFKSDKNTYIFTSNNPINEDLYFELKSLFPKNDLKIYYSTKEEIEKVLTKYSEKFNIDADNLLNLSASEILKNIINHGVSLNTSDIHFEPFEDEVIIRYRIDGLLRTIGNLQKELYLQILNRLKILAKLKIDEHFSTMDGSFREKINNNNIDIRLSILPVVEGEKCVLRLLYDYTQNMGLNDLGLDSNLINLLKEQVSKPYGMVIVAGPTGSGKTTTLYELIKQINSKEINITTIEDPVEYKIKGVNQIQVNKYTNLTFAKGLRSIVRQDPNIILVGEIRDRETADISINAALTGHTVLSTFHANQASGVIPRIIEMGVEPYLLVSGLSLIISQRLVRKICDKCKVSYSTSSVDILKKYPGVKKYFTKDINLYKGKGCEKCSYTGYLNRIAIVEYIVIDTDFHKLIINKATAQDILNLTTKKGYSTMLDDAINKVKTGITTIEEVMKVGLS